jgi:threonine dehydrogenase-like Zn-dependent dehydrogenase
MKAAVTTQDHGFEVVDLPDPSPEPDQLVIRVAACGVCGSDIKAQPFAPAGMVMGHELGGEIVAVGPHTDAWPQGTNVAVLPVISCESCQYCRAGLVSHCPQASYIGMGPPGGFAEYAAVPARHCFALSAEVPAAHSALVEPFAVGLHGVHSAEIVPGDEVLIVGAGGVGLTTLIWALHKGGARVTVADPDAQRRDSASSTGRRTPRACARLPAGAAATGPPRRFRCLRRADHHRAHHGAAQGTDGSVLRRLLARRIPRGRRRVRARGHRPDPDGRADIRVGPHRRSVRRRP